MANTNHEIDAQFRVGSLTAPGRLPSAISASRRIAELPWTQILEEFSSQFGQERLPCFIFSPNPNLAESLQGGYVSIFMRRYTCSGFERL
jgi:hypothetical protein